MNAYSSVLKNNSNKNAVGCTTLWWAAFVLKRQTFYSDFRKNFMSATNGRMEISRLQLEVLVGKISRSLVPCHWCNFSDMWVMMLLMNTQPEVD